ncbi:hypothetical protein [Geodermatophilus sp. CPCC 205761]|uniref:hypothetical protein n=1 Tax=Geodermatophilus sp. CPCC 205761 TaxID=2936597 RepID=UPI003EEFF998
MALVPLLLVLALAGALAVGTAVARRSPPSRETTVAAARTHAVGTTATALLVGAAAATAVGVAGLGNASPGSLGRTALLVPVAAGVVHVVVLGLGELTWPRPQGQVRRARLVRRRLLDAAPRWLVRTTVGAGVAAVVTIALGAALAAPDGRSLLVEDPPFRSTAGPFPGLVYGRPAGLGLLVLAAVTVAALWIVATRSAVVTEDDRIEDAVRRASAHRVLRAAAATTLVVAGGLLAVAGNAAWSISSTTGGGVLAVLGVGVGGCGLAALLAGVLVACVRAPGVPADRPVPA